MALDAGIINSVEVANTKVYGDTMATLQSLSIHNAIARNQIAQSNFIGHQGSMNQVAVSVLAKSVNMISNPSMEAAIATEKEGSAGLAEAVSNMLGALASGQIGAKIAESTPPETAKPKAKA